MKKLTLLLLSVLCTAATAFAYDFKSGDLYYNITSENTVEVTYQYEGWEGNNYQGLTTATIPETVTYGGTTYSVTSIGYWAFRYCSSLTSITIPNSITSIGEWAFFGCSSLPVVDNVRYADTYLVEAIDKSLSIYTIKAGTKWIGDAAFNSCSALTSITIPNSVTSIGNWVFGECTSLTSMIVESGNTIYDSRENCNAIIETATNTLIVGCQTTTIPNSVTSIGDYAFADCTSLTSVTIPNSVTSIRYAAFRDCFSLTTITIPNSVTSIGGEAFAHCFSLTSITIPNSVTSIGEEAFSWCSSLTSITIPNSVTSIGDGAFYECTALTSVVWNAQDCKGWTDAANAPFRSSREQITSFTFGNQVETIPAYLCDSMVNIKEINIPNSVKTIREGVFNNNVKLAKVTIGTSVETIEANAFAGCKRLYDIYCYPTYPPLAENNSFANYNVYVYVPCENQRDYTLDVVWGEFKFIECIGSEVVVLPDDEVTVAPSYEDVTITWPSTDGAETYSLVITKGDITFCTLVFNAQGQLVSIAFKPRRQNAPAEEGTTPATYAEQTANGFRFKVTGLDEGTDYAYTLTVRNAANSVLETYTGEFTTQSDNPMGIHESAGENTPAGQAEKILQNGQVLILRNGETYDMMGQML